MAASEMEGLYNDSNIVYPFWIQLILTKVHQKTPTTDSNLNRMDKVKQALPAERSADWPSIFTSFFGLVNKTTQASHVVTWCTIAGELSCSSFEASSLITSMLLQFFVKYTQKKLFYLLVLLNFFNNKYFKGPLIYARTYINYQFYKKLKKR